MKIQPYMIIVSALIMANLLSSCSTPTAKDLSKENIIPQPAVLTATGSSFEITQTTKIIIGDGSEELKRIGEYFARLIRPATGFSLVVNQGNQESTNSFNFFVSNSFPELGEEGYRLNITDNIVKLEANKAQGIFRGIQTIRQLFPPEIEKLTPQNMQWELASGTIEDYPNYEYRGAMLDVSRHFFEVDDVKQYIDWLARYKMNKLHLHLSDDQGWRIEIKKWPKLTEIGSSTEVGGGEGGYYTQEQYVELVNYANERFITIIPEIDMPGHTNAALASYAELNCDNKTTDLYTGVEVGFSTFCTQKEIVYKFIDDVIGELAQITPGPFIHIGGDESLSTEKEDYIEFVDRVQDIVIAHGKQMIGWDEIALTQVKPGTVAQFWGSHENAQEAVKKGIKVIYSPANRTYLDMKYDSTTTLGQNWAGNIEVDKGYDWYPASLVPGVAKENILGIECPLWTETLTNIDELEYMAFPRLLGYAEIGWSPAEARSWEEYKQRLGNHAARFEEMGINYYPSELIDWVSQRP
jgi:hexosaminidase